MTSGSTGMRIAVSGAHGTGKSTLIAELAELLPGYRVIEEPYHAMVAHGYVFPEKPGREDYAAQLERSIASLAEIDGGGVVFDRCPADFLAYLAALGGADPAELRDAVSAARGALDSIDLVAYVPIESPDRIGSQGMNLPRLRRRVDQVLRDMLIDDGWGLGATVLEVHGPASDRARLVAAHAAAG